MSTLTGEIELAVLARLQAKEIGQPGGYLRTLRSYGGGARDARRSLVAPMPAVFVAWAGASYDEAGGDCVAVVSLWDVTVADDSSLGEVARRQGQGEGSHPGVYRMLEDVRALLWGWAPVEGVGPFELAEVRREEVSESVAAFRQRWRARYLETL